MLTLQSHASYVVPQSGTPFRQKNAPPLDAPRLRATYKRFLGGNNEDTCNNIRSLEPVGHVGQCARASNLPQQLNWTAYDTGSAGYNQAVAIGAALQDAAGVNLRVLPGKNDVSRTEPLRQGRVEFSATGVGGSFMAQEGVFDFGAENWGPQPIRVLMANNGGAINLAVGVAGDLGIETYADLKGKRVAYIVGAPALNVNTEAYLAYGGLTWDDVERVDFGGFGASWTGLIEGQVDAAFASTNSGKAYEAEAGPRGLFWPPDRS